MASHANFLIGVSLVDPAADPVVLEFQQEPYQEDRIAVRAPRGLYRQLGPAAFAEQMADYYLQQHPAEVERVGRAAVQDATEWSQADTRHPQGVAVASGSIAVFCVKPAGWLRARRPGITAPTQWVGTAG